MLERSTCFGGEGNPVFSEVCSALFQRDLRVKRVNYVYGVGGRDTIPSQFTQVYRELLRIAEGGVTEPARRFLGLRDY